MSRTLFMRLVQGGTLVASVVSLTSLCWAVEPAGGAPDPAEAPAAAEPSSDDLESGSTSEPVSPTSRTWLRDTRASKSVQNTDADAAKGGTTPVVFGFLLLAGLAGAAMLLRMRRRATPTVLSRSPIRVVSTTKLSPKSSLVAVDVNGRVLLLGVTDGSVSELGWLEDDAEAEADLEEGEDMSPLQPAGVPRGFKDVLGGILGGSGTGRSRFASGAEVAPMLAESTQDVLRRRTVTSNAESATQSRRGVPRSSPLRALNDGMGAETSARSEPDSVRIEAQAAGLARRRR